MCAKTCPRVGPARTQYCDANWSTHVLFDALSFIQYEHRTLTHRVVFVLDALSDMAHHSGVQGCGV